MDLFQIWTNKSLSGLSETALEDFWKHEKMLFFRVSRKIDKNKKIKNIFYSQGLSFALTKSIQIA